MFYEHELKILDDWRRQQDWLPNRSAAIRALVMRAIQDDGERRLAKAAAKGVAT